MMQVLLQRLEQALLQPSLEQTAANKIHGGKKAEGKTRDPFFFLGVYALIIYSTLNTLQHNKLAVNTVICDRQRRARYCAFA